MSHGLFDLQVNGFAGIDFQRPQITRADLERAAEALRRHHTTGILFTLITDTIEALAAQYGAQEMMLVNMLPTHAERRRSYQLVAEVFGLSRAAAAARLSPKTSATSW